MGTRGAGAGTDRQRNIADGFASRETIEKQYLITFANEEIGNGLFD